MPGTPGASGPISGPTAGPVLPGSPRGPGSGSSKTAAPREVFWESWWEHNKERLLVRRPVTTVSPAAKKPVAAKTMEEVRNSSLLPALRKLATDPHCGIRATAILSLGRTGDRADLAVALRGLRDVCPEVRQASCLALGLLADEASGLQLSRILEDEETAPRVRAMAAAGLGLFPGPEVSADLTRVLSDPKAALSVRSGAAVALGFHSDPAAPAALVAIAKDRDGEPMLRALAVQGLGRQGRLESVPLLVTLTRDDAVPVRRAAVLALGAIQYQSDAQISLAAAIQRQIDWQSRGALSRDAAASLDESIRELEARADAEQRRVLAVRQETMRALLRLVDGDPDLQTRAYALIALGEAGARECLPTIGRILDRSHHPLKAWAALTAGLLGEPELLPSVRRAFLKPGEDDEVRGALAIALGLLSDRETAAPLAALAADQEADPELRGHALLALAMMGRPDALRIGARLVEKRSNPALRRSAALALGLVGQEDAAALLERLLTTDSTPEVRSAAALGLGYLRDAAVAEELVGVAADSTTEFPIRIHAIAALGYLGARTAGPPAMARFAWHYDYRNHLVSLDRLISLL